MTLQLEIRAIVLLHCGLDSLLLKFNVIVDSNMTSTLLASDMAQNQ